MGEVITISEQTSPKLRGAGFGIRLLARLIDLFVTTFVGSFMLYVVGYIIIMVTYYGGDYQGSFYQQFAVEDSSTEIMMTLFAWVAYHAVAERVSGTTVGKWITGLTVVQEDGSTPIRIRQGIGRNLAVLIDSVCLGQPAVQSMYKSPQRQRHGDVWNHTMVVRRRDLPPAHRQGVGMILASWFAALTVFAILSMLGNLARIL